MLLRICWLPDSYPTSNSLKPLAFNISNVFRGTLAFALQDQVNPNRPSPFAISSAHGKLVALPARFGV
jgi:hypothetical protein